jgi:DNA primase
MRSQSLRRLPDDEFDRVVREARERHNISDIIGRHTALKKRGSRELVGLCCFHSERTPSLDVNDAKGTYHCHGCGAGGDAVTFLMNKEGMRFFEAIKWLLGDELPVISEEDRTKRKAEDERATADRIALARWIWSTAVPAAGTPAEVYARSRGITIPLPPTVRFVTTPRWRNPETGEVGRDHPAMICALQNASGAVVGCQCVFLMDDGRRKYERVRDDGTKAKAKLTFGVAIGSALRLGPAREHIITCTGPENGLSLLQMMPERSIWVAVGDAVIDQVAYPPEVKSVCLTGDNDASGRAAIGRAREAVLSHALKASETYPHPDFSDWNDQLRGVAK